MRRSFLQLEGGRSRGSAGLSLYSKSWAWSRGKVRAPGAMAVDPDLNMVLLFSCSSLGRKWRGLHEGQGPPRGGSGNLLQYSCLKHPMDRGAWGASPLEVRANTMFP